MLTSQIKLVNSNHVSWIAKRSIAEKGETNVIAWKYHITNQGIPMSNLDANSKVLILKKINCLGSILLNKYQHH